MTDTTNTQRIAKRRLSAFNFAEEGSHLALVHKEQGGAANGYSTLVMKATGKYTPEFIQKVQQVRVTLDLDDFLEKFFGVWEDDAKVLASLFGYQETEKSDDAFNDDSFWRWMREKYGDRAWEVDPTDQDYQEWVASRLQGIEILKSLHTAPNKVDALAGLDEGDYLTVLKAQEAFEGALIANALSVGVQPVRKSVKKKQTKVNKAKQADHNEEPLMPEANQPELIEKAHLTDLQKAHEAQAVELQKAQEQLALYKAAEAAAITKARKDSVLAVVTDTEEAEKLFKAVSELPDDNFQAVLDVVKGLNSKLEDTGFFTEAGAKPVADTQVQKSTLRANLEAKYQK